MVKGSDTLSEIGKALCADLGFNPTSDSTKPLYVANSLFRACTGIECKVDDIHEWIVSERRSKATSSEEILKKYGDIIYCSGANAVDEIKEIRFYLEKLFNPDSTVYPSPNYSVMNIPSKWLVRSQVLAEAGIGTFLYKILNTPIDGERSKAISVIRDALMNDDDDLSRTVKPIIVRKPEEERISKSPTSQDIVKFSQTSKTIRDGFDRLAENCEAFSIRNGKNSLLTLRRMVNFSMFATFYYLIDINHSAFGGHQIPLLLDTDANLRAIERASETCFISCKKAVEDYTVNFIGRWIHDSKIISDENSETACNDYIVSGFSLNQENEKGGVRDIITQHLLSNCRAGDKPLLATAKALQFALYTYTYPYTTPSDFCNVLGVKAGFVGPCGNAAKYKRFLINRFLLETIVLSVVDVGKLEDGIELRELGDILRNCYNIIIGTDTDVDYCELDRYGIARATPEDLRGELSDNAREIANMLISTGLAKKYADGVTIIGWGL